MANEIQSSVCIGSNAGRFQDDGDYIASENVFIGAECGDNVRNNTQCVVIGSQADVVGAATSEIVAVGRNAKAYNTGSVVIGANINDGDYSEAAILIGETQQFVRLGAVLYNDLFNRLFLKSASAEPASGLSNDELYIQIGDPDTDIDGDPLYIFGGFSTGTGRGSEILIEAGYSEDGIAGVVSVRGGIGEGTGNGGDTIIEGGESLAATGGGVLIEGGYGITGGGNVALAGGEADTGGGGIVLITGGFSNASFGGPVLITGGEGADSGGGVEITGSYGPTEGGNVMIGPGSADTAADNGRLELTDGSGNTMIQISEENLMAFYGEVPITRPTVTGNSAMEKADSLVAALAALGLIIDATT